MIENWIVGELPGTKGDYVILYHRASNKAKAESIQMYGPDKGLDFYLTPDKNVAKHAAGPNGKVLTFKIPKEKALEILGNPSPYAGIFGEGWQYITSGEFSSKKLYNYLLEKIQIY